MSIEDNKDLNGAWRDMENLSHTTTQKKEKMGVGFLRQWLNEDRITDPKKMVTNEELLVWIDDVPRREFAGASYVSEVAPTPSIDEIVKELLHDVVPHTPLKLEETNQTEYDKGYIFYQDLVIRGVKESKEKIQTLLTSYRQSIYKELIDAIEEAKREEDWRNIEGVTAGIAIGLADFNRHHNEGLEKATQIIKQKQEEI